MLASFYGGEFMIKKIDKEIEKLEKEKSKLINSQQGVQKRLSEIDIEIKRYKTLKNSYKKLEEKFNNCVNIIEGKNNVE